MTSLVLTHYRPHRPSAGSPLRIWQNIRALGLLGPVDVVSVGVEDEAAAVPGIRRWVPFPMRARSRWDRLHTACWLLRRTGCRSVDQFHSGAAAQWLRGAAAARPYDVAVLETLSVAAYLPDAARVASHVVFDAHNVESALYADAAAAGLHSGRWRRTKDAVLRHRMRLVESRVVSSADTVWACSELDAAQLRAAYGRHDAMAVVPNGVDTGAYSPDLSSVLEDWSARPVTLLYVGSFGYDPNADAAMRLMTEVLPAIRARGCAARLVLVGRSPTPTMLAAARADSGIEVTGEVEATLPHLRQPCVVALPITVGSGTRLKVVEAFAACRPVVSTAKGAEGLAVADGSHLLIRDSSEAIADAAVELWRRPFWRARLCAEALALVRARYSWSAAASAIAQSLGHRCDADARRRDVVQECCQ